MLSIRVRRLAIAASLGGLLALSAGLPAGQPRADGFAAQIAALSEPPGYFDTDNLISNERSYLEVVPALRGPGGGVYIGVGPDQNFTYIAALRPSTAFIVDIRRDNLLLQLLFKSLFALSTTRVEYLAQLLGRSAPAPIDGWHKATIDEIVRHLDRAPPLADGALDALRTRVNAQISRSGVPLSAIDLATIDRFHRRFIADGLELRFHSTGRPPRSYYPTYRELLLARDPSGVQANCLAAEEGFQFVRSLQSRDRIIPVTGDLSGPHALVAIGRLLSSRGERLSAIYTSNVEQYLFRGGRFSRFAANLAALPRDERAVIIRSVFGGWDGSSSHVQPVSRMLEAMSAGRVRGYHDLIGGR
ncbi:MAG TPA: hypothetical protein VD833_04515 [Vicinamibacterales bacterium]|nr:hypothetical protein [Vicinamibacterales bacterium]